MRRLSRWDDQSGLKGLSIAPAHPPKLVGTLLETFRGRLWSCWRRSSEPLVPEYERLYHADVNAGAGPGRSMQPRRRSGEGAFSSFFPPALGADLLVRSGRKPLRRRAHGKQPAACTRASFRPAPAVPAVADASLARVPFAPSPFVAFLLVEKGRDEDIVLPGESLFGLPSGSAGAGIHDDGASFQASASLLSPPPSFQPTASLPASASSSPRADARVDSPGPLVTALRQQSRPSVEGGGEGGAAGEGGSREREFPAPSLLQLLEAAVAANAADRADGSAGVASGHAAEAPNSETGEDAPRGRAEDEGSPAGSPRSSGRIQQERKRSDVGEDPVSCRGRKKKRGKGKAGVAPDDLPADEPPTDGKALEGTGKRGARQKKTASGEKAVAAEKQGRAAVNANTKKGQLGDKRRVVSEAVLAPEGRDERGEGGGLVESIKAGDSRLGRRESAAPPTAASPGIQTVDGVVPGLELVPGFEDTIDAHFVTALLQGPDTQAQPGSAEDRRPLQDEGRGEDEGGDNEEVSPDDASVAGPKDPRAAGTNDLQKGSTSPDPSTPGKAPARSTASPEPLPPPRPPPLTPPVTATPSRLKDKDTRPTVNGHASATPAVKGPSASSPVLDVASSSPPQAPEATDALRSKGARATSEAHGGEAALPDGSAQVPDARVEASEGRPSTAPPADARSSAPPALEKTSVTDSSVVLVESGKAGDDPPGATPKRPGAGLTPEAGLEGVGKSYAGEGSAASQSQVEEMPRPERSTVGSGGAQANTECPEGRMRPSARGAGDGACPSAVVARPALPRKVALRFTPRDHATQEKVARHGYNPAQQLKAPVSRRSVSIRRAPGPGPVCLGNAQLKCPVLRYGGSSEVARTAEGDGYP